MFNGIGAHLFICSDKPHVRRLPGISLTVVLPGYNVFKQLPPCHPGREEGETEEWNKEEEEEEGNTKEGGCQHTQTNRSHMHR